MTLVYNKDMAKSFFLIVLLLSLCISCFSQDDSIAAPQTDTTQSISTPIHDSVFMRENNITSTNEKTPTVEKKQVYKLKPAVDIPIGVIGSGWSLYAFTKIYDKTPPTEEEVLMLDKSDINGFDRWAVRTYSSSLDKLSYIPFYASIPIPFVVMLVDEDMRKDFWKITFLYWETMSVTGLFGTGGTYLVDRFRPYAYDINTPLEKRSGKNALNSFYAGHVEIAATPAFFIAKVYSDYHPESKAKWAFYSFAAASTAAMAYMRLEAGMHFPSDLLLGISMGVAAGVLIPHFHKQKKNGDLTVLPYRNDKAHGLTFIYKLNRKN
jgi:membrane-associated phospholipid phosphatase